MTSEQGTQCGAAAPVVSAERQEQLTRRIRLLTKTTISYNVVEAVVAISAGVVASSVALVGFGLDSVIEVSSAVAVAWQFAAANAARRQLRERAALRVIAVSFFALAVFVGFESVEKLVTGAPVQHTTVGLVVTGVSLVLMPFLATMQRRAARELNSRSALADSKQTMLCTYMSAIVLVGLLAHSVLGWSWVDPVAGLLIAGVALKEGFDAWQGKACGCSG